MVERKRCSFTVLSDQPSVVAVSDAVGARSPKRYEAATAAVDQDVAAGDEGPVRPHQQSRDGADLIGGGGAADRAQLDHATVACSAWAGELVTGQRGDHDAGADGVDPSPSSAPADGLGHDAQGVASFGQLVGVQRVGDGLQQRQGEQLLHRGERECPVLIGGQGAEPVPGLGGDHDPRAARGDDVPELLQDHGGAVQVDAQDGLRRGLAGRDSRGMDEAGHRTEVARGPDEGAHRLPGSHIHHRGGGFEAGIAKHFGGGICVLGAQVGEQDVLARADPAGDGLADGAGSDDDNDVTHEKVLSSMVTVGGGDRRWRVVRRN